MAAARQGILDVKVFNHLAQSNAVKDLQKVYSQHQRSKKREYNARILEVEKASFTPVIFSCSGGASSEATKLLKTIALKLSVKRKESYSTTMNFLRRRISFDLIRTCVLSFRGNRGASSTPIEELDIGQQRMEGY